MKIQKPVPQKPDFLSLVLRKNPNGTAKFDIPKILSQGNLAPSQAVGILLIELKNRGRRMKYYNIEGQFMGVTELPNDSLENELWGYNIRRKEVCSNLYLILRGAK